MKRKKTTTNFFNTSRKKHIVDGIVMHSDLEVDTYLYLKSYGIKPKYEGQTFECVPETSVTVKYFNNTSEKTKSKLSKAVLQNIEYTPDFIFDYNGFTVYLECKGYATNEFKMRFKLFRRMLEQRKDKDRYIVAKIYTILQLKLFLDQLKNLSNKSCNQVKMNLK